jgi:hypothetical protein
MAGGQEAGAVRMQAIVIAYCHLLPAPANCLLPGDL